jgi:transposase
MSGFRKNRIEALAAKVASGDSVRKAAEDLGITERHGYRLSALPEFKAKVAEIRTALTSAAAGRLASGMETAALVLRKLTTSGRDEKTQLAAAKAVIDSALRVAEISELRGRMEAIEARLNATKATKR